jgi:hypothetical protein
MFTLTHVVISVLGIIICARHIALRLADTPPRTLVVVDYLQVLDQRRDKPPLEDQVRELKGFARARQAVIVCLSQISRTFDLASKPYPGCRTFAFPIPSIFRSSTRHATSTAGRCSCCAEAMRRSRTIRRP